MFLLLRLYSRLFSARVVMLTGMLLLLRPSAGHFSHALHSRRTRNSAPSEEEPDSTWRQGDLGGLPKRSGEDFFYAYLQTSSDI